MCSTVHWTVHWPKMENDKWSIDLTAPAAKIFDGVDVGTEPITITDLDVVHVIRCILFFYKPNTKLLGF
jgi:hypothetical protein